MNRKDSLLRNMFGNKALENLHVETFVDHVDPTKPYDGTARAMPTDPIITIDQDSIEPTTTSFKALEEALISFL